MNKKLHSSIIRSAISNASFYKLFALAVVIANLLLCFKIATMDGNEKTIITPANFDRPFWVKGDEVSPEYIEQMARYFSQLLLTYQKTIANQQFEQVLRYVDPNIYADMQAQFKADAERISRNDIASVFYPLGIEIKKHTAYLSGRQMGLVGSQLVGNKETIYQMDFAFNGGKLSITGYKQVAKDSVGNYRLVTGDDELNMNSKKEVEATEPESTQVNAQ